MQITAYFIGGPWDLTKKVLSREEEIIFAYEPEYPLKPTAHNPTKDIVCNVHRYMARGCTNDDAIIYEYIGTQ